MNTPLLIDHEIPKLLEALHGQLPQGVAVFDARLRLKHANRHWLAFAQRVLSHTPTIEPGAPLSDFLGEQSGWLDHAVQRALAGETMHITGQAFAPVEGEAYWDVTLAPVLDDGLVTGLVSIVEEATARVQAERSAETLREREAQYHSIFSETTDGLVIYTLGVRSIVEANPAFCALTGYRRDELLSMDPLLLIAAEDHQRVIDAGDIVTDAGRFMVTVTVLRKDGTTFDAELNRTNFSYHGHQHGLAVVRDVTERAQSFRFLEAKVAERTSELQTLLEISRTISLASDPEPLFELIFDQIRRLAEYEAVAISLLENDHLRTVAVRRDTIGSRFPSSLGNRMFIDWQEPIWQALAAGRAVYTPDVHSDDDVARWFRRNVGEQLHTTFAHVRSELSVPLVVQNEMIGAMFISSAREARFEQHDVDLIVATANQVAVAIQNSRLNRQARSLAALEERQRLARELHDSVSQALFGIGLGAETARATIERNPPQAISAIDYVLQLAQAGMAEMRALIFELRPESLEKEGLVAALDKQAASTRARHAIAVNLAADPEPDIALEAKEALYRIAQEAMHNTVKHARATTIDLRLTIDGDTVTLEVRDNGNGFDASGTFPGHLGLVSMRERMAQLDGSLTLESTPGTGTLIRATVPISSSGSLGRHKTRTADFQTDPRPAG